MSSKQLSHNGENPEENSVKNPAEKSVNGPASAFNAAENAKIKAATNKNEDESSEPVSSVLKDHPPSEYTAWSRMSATTCVVPDFLFANGSTL